MPAKPRRIPITVTPELQKVIDLFMSTYPDHRFSEAAVLRTFVEAGVREWYFAEVMPQAGDNQ